MDTSKKYILMCEKARKIQLMLPLFSKRIHSFFWADGKIGGWLEVVNTKTIKYIWLPRQDQLQDMLTEEKNPLDNKELERNTAINRLLGSLWDNVSMHWKKNEYYWQFESMEQLWLGFTMKEKYRKVWNDKEKEWNGGA